MDVDISRRESKKMDILYEDKELIVVIKPSGVESQSAKALDADMVSMIKNYLSKENGISDPYVGVVHRLDKPVSGIMVYAKEKEAAAALSKQVASGGMKKIYQAIVCGQPKGKEGHLVDYLSMDNKTNTSLVVSSKDKNGKKAELNYKLLKHKYIDGKQLSRLEIELLTGRHHQIRVQLSHAGLPIVGDRKYNPMYSDKEGKEKGTATAGKAAGDKGGSLALAAVSLTFTHPKTRRSLSFSYMPKGDIWNVV